MENEDDYIITIDTNVSANIDSTINISDITYDTIDINTLTITGGDTITLDNWSQIHDVFTTPVEFEDRMPDVAKVEDMCNDYPALAKAYENFKTIYKMVHQDWQGKQEDNEPPF